MAGGPSLVVPTEEFVVAVVFSPGEELAHDDVGVRDCAAVLGVVKIAAEAGEGVEPVAGVDDALDDAGRVGGFQSSAIAWEMRRSWAMVMVNASTGSDLRV